jgi:hypothetical protein
MFGIPDNFPFHKLIGATLQQVCTGQYQLQLHFDGGQRISIESALRLNDAGDKFSNFIEASTPICRFLGEAISEASAPDQRTLRLVFANGVMEIFDDTDQYEAFQVGFHGEGEFII